MLLEYECYFAIHMIENEHLRKISLLVKLIKKARATIMFMFKSNSVTIRISCSCRIEHSREAVVSLVGISEILKIDASIINRDINKPTKLEHVCY